MSATKRNTPSSQRIALVFVMAMIAVCWSKPASAASERTGDWFVECRYQASRDGSPRYRSRIFMLSTGDANGEIEAAREAATASWIAWARSNAGLAPDDTYGANCRITPEAYYTELLEGHWRNNGGEVAGGETWSPGFGSPFKIPAEFYYYCEVGRYKEDGSYQWQFSDLFKVPVPENGIPSLREIMNEASRKWSTAAYLHNNESVRGVNANRCEVTAPEAFRHYTRKIDALVRAHRELVRIDWKGIHTPAAPNLIDDAVARAKYAAMLLHGSKREAGAMPKSKKKEVGTASGASYKPPALTITAPKPVSQEWTPEQLARANEAAAEKAKTAARVLKNEIKMQEDLKKFWDEKRKQGRSQ